MATVLLTGATGYIGSHTWLALLAAGHEVVGLDDFSNSSPRVLDRLRALSGREPVFQRGSVHDAAGLAALLSRQRVDAVVHFAAFKAVGESAAQPMRYYDNNVAGLVTLCRALQARGVGRFVFSSSATVYGRPEGSPMMREDAATRPESPYARTKLMSEWMLGDQATAVPGWQNACLRYFNPVGAHESGQLGEDPRGVPNNLMPYVAQVAVGRRARLSVFGDDYDTPDGTGVRDYIHVQDLAEGHVAAVQWLMDNPGSLTVNLGTGRGYSVLELVRAFEGASGRSVPYDIAPRRAGDIDQYWADPALAKATLGWTATRGLDAMCADSWRWQSLNPEGFGPG